MYYIQLNAVCLVLLGEYLLAEIRPFHCEQFVCQLLQVTVGQQQ
jgi:hypothetical protein